MAAAAKLGPCFFCTTHHSFTTHAEFASKKGLRMMGLHNLIVRGNGNVLMPSRFSKLRYRSSTFPLGISYLLNRGVSSMSRSLDDLAASTSRSASLWDDEYDFDASNQNGDVIPEMTMEKMAKEASTKLSSLKENLLKSKTYIAYAIIVCHLVGALPQIIIKEAPWIIGHKHNFPVLATASHAFWSLFTAINYGLFLVKDSKAVKSAFSRDEWSTICRIADLTLDLFIFSICVVVKDLLDPRALFIGAIGGFIMGCAALNILKDLNDADSWLSVQILRHFSIGDKINDFIRYEDPSVEIIRWNIKFNVKDEERSKEVAHAIQKLLAIEDPSASVEFEACESPSFTLLVQFKLKYTSEFDLFVVRLLVKCHDAIQKLGAKGVIIEKEGTVLS